MNLYNLGLAVISARSAVDERYSAIMPTRKSYDSIDGQIDENGPYWSFVGMSEDGGLEEVARTPGDDMFVFLTDKQGIDEAFKYLANKHAELQETLRHAKIIAKCAIDHAHSVGSKVEKLGLGHDAETIHNAAGKLDERLDKLRD